MSIVSLELLKQHVRADDFDSDDALLESYLETAEQAVIRETHLTEEELRMQNNGEFPPQLRQAVLLTAGHWYNQREDVSMAQMHTIPRGAGYLINQFRKLADDCGEA